MAGRRLSNSELAVISAVDRAAGRSASDSGQNKLERWQRKLLDLSLRNSLLNYNLERGKRFVEIICPNPTDLEDRLTEGERFRLYPALDILQRGLTLPDLSPTADEAALTKLAEDLSPKNVLIAPLGLEEMENRLITLYRAARSSLEESGAVTLYLVFGFLAWRAARRDKPCLAPLVLMPVTLERQTVAGGFAMSLGDDEPRFNLVLLEMLRKDFGITGLEHFGRGLPSGEGGRDLPGLWRQVAETVRRLPGWTMVDTVGLGLFSFANYLMWKDLSENSGILKRNDLVRHLLSPDAALPEQEPFPDPQQLDEKLPPNECHIPLSADSSQVSAIVAAAEGKDFVLIGPPGTGKSQTIANIIAQALAAGRTVLFVAEKAAALRVVSQRLERIGLGSFCLELYSSKAGKLGVLKQLERSAGTVIPAEAGQWETLAQRLADVRSRLNEYSEQLHMLYPNGLTPFLAMGEVLNNPDCPEVKFTWPATDQHDQTDFEELREAARQLGVQGEQARKLNETALSLIQHREWSPIWEESLIKAVRELHAACVALRESAGKAAEISRLPILKAEGESLTPWLELVRLLPLAWGHDWRFLLGPNLEQRLTDLSRGAGLLTKYDENWKDLSLPYKQEVLQINLETAAETWFAGQAAVGPKKWILQNKVRRLLTKHSELRGEPDLPADLLKLTDLTEIRDLILDCHNLGPESGGLWAGFQTRLDELEVTLDFAARLNDSLSRLEMTPRLEKQVMSGLEYLFGSGNELLAPGGELAQLFDSWSDAVVRFWEAADALKNLAASDYHLTGENVAVAAAICAGLVKERPHINAWCAWLRAGTKANDLGLANLVTAVLDGVVAPTETEEAMFVNYARWWTPQVLEELPALVSFAGTEQERILAAFRELDREMGRLAGAAIAARLRSGEPWEKTAPGEWKIFQRELAKKRRRKPVRQLLASIPSLVRQLTPCFLMSPLSISQYLESGYEPFDLLIFDEASQIPVWDAVGAMARAKRVVVVGDPKQLPPTDIFQKAEDTEYNEVEEDLESILDECLALSVPAVCLNWHYRSRHESLIDFSNQRYYNGELVTFPAPRTGDMVISCHSVNGSYERGSSRTNPVEARAVVEAIVRQLESDDCQRHGFSLGVVAFNRPQQQLIEDLLDGERRLNPALDRFFDPASTEPVMIKNLENIQGDERDIMFFSACYGPDVTGQISMNFGVLNKISGERRLNVAVTRARRALRVFCSFKPEDIDLNRTNAQGVRDLKQFLIYAQAGGSRPVRPGADNTDSHRFESSFEEAVAKALTHKGWRIIPQVGSSYHRVNLGVVHPTAPERFLAGLETDGLSYQAAATARDRDILRESVLKNLGWQIIRVWSTDWWINPEAAANRLHQRLVRLAKST